MKNKFILALVVVILFGLCALSTQSYAVEPVIADGLADISINGETDLLGNFFLSFVFSRNLIMLDGKGSIIW